MPPYWIWAIVAAVRALWLVFDPRRDLVLRKTETDSYTRGDDHRRARFKLVDDGLLER